MTASHAPSTYSETSTIYSFDKDTTPETEMKTKGRRSMRQRVKKALRNIGHPPTYAYDLEHGVDTQRTVPVGPMGSNVLNQPSRM
ncbi:hypothetical protein CCHL11_09682 [Colletotrichum chlorophyti]|uniref:Uncharacterized protein n=1 Tax=Colletotrichum chlorophyti TaxID=708187 RepID=A0A1Q8R9W9_9PEZI|nr:hypothetical protein CCHL11_09682 [Colletotrichum chlorophyti]